MKTKTNETAPVKCSKSILIRATPEKVWAALGNINDWANWQTDVANAKINGPLQPNSTFDWKTGGAKIHSTFHTVDVHKSLGWTGRTMGLFAIHNWELSTHNGQTMVTVDESMEGVLARWFKKSFNKNLEKGMVHWLELLKKESEK